MFINLYIDRLASFSCLMLPMTEELYLRNSIVTAFSFCKLHWATIFYVLTVVLISTTDLGYFCTDESRKGIRFFPSGQVSVLS